MFSSFLVPRQSSIKVIREVYLSPPSPPLRLVCVAISINSIDSIQALMLRLAKRAPWAWPEPSKTFCMNYKLCPVDHQAASQQQSGSVVCKLLIVSTRASTWWPQWHLTVNVECWIIGFDGGCSSLRRHRRPPPPRAWFLIEGPFRCPYYYIKYSVH